MFMPLFDNPTAATTRPAVRRFVGRSVTILVAMLGVITLRQSAGAQQPDSARTAAPVSALFTSEGDPPLSPTRAFLYSLAVPGLGQSRLDRGNAAALFTSAETFAIGMLVKSYYDLGVAKRFSRDSTPTTFELDPETGEFVPRGFVTGQFSPGLVRARRLHVEDWIAALVLTHLLSGIDAFVAAQLWDVPVDLDVSATPRGTRVSAGFRW